MVEGILLVHKPRGVTSHDVVQIIRRKLSVKRVGHTGTLDPMAEGLLVVLVGSATKHQQAFQAHEKAYQAVLRLGTQTDTGDAMGSPIRTASVPTLDRDRVAALIASFTGPLNQTPPAYSAVKVRGHPAYWWARRQQPIALSARRVHLSEVALVGCDRETVTFRVRCSAGTYIRVLGESIAERLGTVGHLTGLVRSRVGDWRLEDAKPLDWFADASPEAVLRELHPIAPRDQRATVNSQRASIAPAP